MWLNCHSGLNLSFSSSASVCGVRLALCLCTFLLFQLSTVRRLQWLNLNHSHPTNPASVTREAATAAMKQMYESGSEPTINPPTRGLQRSTRRSGATPTHELCDLALAWRGLMWHMWYWNMCDRAARHSVPNSPLVQCRPAGGLLLTNRENLNPRCVLRKRRADPMAYVACVVSG